MGKLNGNSKNYLILEDHASWQIAASVSKSANCGYFSSKWLFYGLQMVVTNDLLTWKMIHGWKMTHVLFIEKLVPFQNQHSFIFGEKKKHMPTTSNDQVSWLRLEAPSHSTGSWGWIWWMDVMFFLFLARGKPLNSPILMASNLMHICFSLFIYIYIYTWQIYQYIVWDWLMTPWLIGKEFWIFALHFLVATIVIGLMEEILHQLKCIKPL